MDNTLRGRLQKNLMGIEYNQGIDRLIKSLIYEIDNKTFINLSGLQNYLIGKQSSINETLKALKLNAKQLSQIIKTNNAIKQVQSSEIFSGSLTDWELFLTKNRNREEHIRGLLTKSKKLLDRYLKRKQKHFDSKLQQPTNERRKV